uniref:Putative signal transducing adaptor protein stam/stam2 n=1 Tax=Culex tarsalis TaxID=7177 RepID=A0A1Q3F9G8_CULTA
MEVCDKVTNGAASSKECLKIIVKRLNHSDPHVVIQAITLLDACVSNCGKQFHLEIASREFETEFKKLLQKSQPTVNTRLKLCLKKWAESEFKIDPQLNLIPSLYQKLRSEGHDFSDPSVTPKREAPLSKDPNVVSSQQEEEDIAKAIELSLKETKASGGGSSNQSPKMGSGAGGGGSSLYPSALLATVPAVEARKVRALYDFEAAEDNELTFQAGEIIMVLDDSDPNWWKGQNQRGEGLFPSNFVSSDLNAEPEPSVKSKKSVQFSDEKKEEEAAGGGGKDQVVEINEEKIDRLLHLLHEADPEDPSTDSEEMLKLEQFVNQMGPLIDTELERVDRKHAQLTQLSSDLVEAINLYHTLMREPDRSMMMGGMGPSGYGGGMPGFPGQSSMPAMYNMPPPAMYAHNLPRMSFPGLAPPPYGGMPQLRHDMGQMNITSGPQFPPPQQAMPSMSHNGPTSIPTQQQQQQQQPQQMQPAAQQPPPHAAQHLPNMPPMVGPGSAQQPAPASAAPPHTMMTMSHMQSPLPQNFPNPTSPPPVAVNSAAAAPTSLPPPQGVLPNQAGPRPSFPTYGPPQQQQPQQQQQAAPATAPPPMNHHPHGGMPSGPMPPFQSSPLPPPHYMQMGHPGGGGGHMPHHHMIGHMMPPPGTPLSINTATASPQNIPIYQQQR